MAKKKISKTANKSKPAAKSPKKTSAKVSVKKGAKASAKKPMPPLKTKTSLKSKTAPKAKTSAKKMTPPPVSKKAAVKVKTPLLKSVANTLSNLNPFKKSSAKVSVEFSPLRDFVLIQRAPEMEITAGGLYIPETASEKPMLGKVLSVGPGAVDKKGRKRPLDVKAGDQVLFGKYSGTEIQIGGNSFLILRENDILGVSSEESK